MEFVNSLAADLQQEGQNWENKDLHAYLEAIASWADAMDGYYENHGLPVPVVSNWKVFADILMAARVYEV